ncbi:TonB family protein [Chamaesiphon sp. VAR_69_metabat_338]|uniref:energy transducer TonB n=1 Tax=Chamaesiphon sp. VAR_69_metabat_338 TaxID=2964704 RepID=UPI00286E7AC7|nr:TonB family protein [Chamaesiphon sp. VAR_69_metabat_338]
MRSPSHPNSPHQLRNILAIGLGSSLILHLGAFWTIARYWQPAVTPEEPIEIELVEPIESVTPAPVTSTPALKPIAVKSESPVTPKPQSTPIIPSIVTPPMATAVKSTPKSIAPKAKPLKFKLPASAKAPVPVKPSKPKLGSPQTNLADKPTPIPTDRPTPPPTSAFAFPRSSPPKPRAKPTPTAIDSPIPARSSRATFDRPTAPTSQPNPSPTQTPTTDRPIAPTSDLVKSQPRSVEPLPTTKPTPPTVDRPISKNPPIPATPASASPPLRTPAPIPPKPTPLAEPPLGGIGSTGNLLQPKNPPRSIAKPLTDGNSNLQPKQSGNPASGGLKTLQGDRVAPTTGSPNATIDGAPSGNPATPNGSGDRQTGSDRGSMTTASNSGSGASNTGLQCIKSCQIAKLQDLQDSDGGKDRLRIRVSIDANGLVTAAEIVKSSGNPQIDRAVLEGIEQMQFQPSGKPIKGVIRANIFL